MSLTAISHNRLEIADNVAGSSLEVTKPILGASPQRSSKNDSHSEAMNDMPLPSRKSRRLALKDNCSAAGRPASYIKRTLSNTRNPSHSSIKRQPSIAITPNNPICKLPAEILIQIFDEVLMDEEPWTAQVWEKGRFRTPAHKRDYSLKSKHCRALSSVCKVWRHTIIQSPRFWALTLKIGGTQTQMREALSAAIQLVNAIPSCSIRLAVSDQPYVAMCPTHNAYGRDINRHLQLLSLKQFRGYDKHQVNDMFTDVVAFIRQIAPRISALWALATYNVQSLQQLINSGQRFPRLEDLDVHTHDNPPQPWASTLPELDFVFSPDKHPLLHHIDCCGIHIRFSPLFRDRGSTGLTGLSLRMDITSGPSYNWSDLAEILNLSSNLTTLNLVRSDYSFNRMAGEPKVVLGRLESIYLSCGFHLIVELLCNCLDLPSLQSMDLTVFCYGDYYPNPDLVTPLEYSCLKTLVVHPSIGTTSTLLNKMSMPVLDSLCSGYFLDNTTYTHYATPVPLALPSVRHLMFGEFLASPYVCKLARSWLLSCPTLTFRRLDFAWSGYTIDDQQLCNTLQILEPCLSSLEFLAITNLIITQPQTITTVLSSFSAINKLRLLNFQHDHAHKQWLGALAGSPLAFDSAGNEIPDVGSRTDGASNISLPNLQVLEIAMRTNCKAALSLLDGRVFVAMAAARAKMDLKLKKIVLVGMFALTTKKKLLEYVDEVVDGAVLED